MTHSLNAISPSGRASDCLIWFQRVILACRRLKEDVRTGRVDIGVPTTEVDRHFEQLDLETAELAYLALVGAAEALLVTDYEARVKARRRDPASVELRRLARRLKKDNARVSYSRDLLPLWRDAVPLARRHVDRAMGLPDLRHWIAHGKFWDGKAARRPIDPVELVAEFTDLFQALGIAGWP